MAIPDDPQWCKNIQKTTTELRIRAYEPHDLQRCRQLWQELTQHHREIYDDPSIGGDVPGLFFDEHLARVGPGRIWVAERDAEIIGLVGLMVNDQEAEIEPIVISSRHRGKGIGRTLVNYVIEEARKLEVRYLNVRPVARNVKAISFFHRAGFRVLGHIELFIDMRSPEHDTWEPGPDLFGHSFKY
jgi:GNAT superfamily N-acetyltransferase